MLSIRSMSVIGKHLELEILTDKQFYSEHHKTILEHKVCEAFLEIHKVTPGLIKSSQSFPITYLLFLG